MEPTHRMMLLMMALMSLLLALQLVAQTGSSVTQ